MYICLMKALKNIIKTEYIKAKQELLKRHSETEINNMITPIVEKTLSQIKIQESVQKIDHDS